MEKPLFRFIFLFAILGGAIFFFSSHEKSFDEQIEDLDVVFVPTGEDGLYAAWSRKQQNYCPLKSDGKTSVFWSLPLNHKYPVGV